MSYVLPGRCGSHARFQPCVRSLKCPAIPNHSRAAPWLLLTPHPVKVRGFGLRRKPARCNYGIHFSKSFGAISFPTLCASNRAAPSVTCPRT